jgi:1-deoxy-D-xylulose-5-phosphate synthase
MYLEHIESPKDIKKLSIEQLNVLADEIRTNLIKKLSEHGGHIGPNLGMVEMTIAMHYVFNSPIDKLVFDVSHQCYPHKMLTGRKEAFLDAAHYDDVTGFTNPLESIHDFFTIGHTSTSVSLATGLAKGRDLTGGNENIIAIIGDGSLSGGEALEALDYAGEYDENLIIIVNDNDQSIAENHGGLYKSLKNLRESNGESSNNIFKGFGLDYLYLNDGHNIKALVELFERVKDIGHPIVLHIQTIKGKGLSYAEEDRESWHAGGPFNIKDGTRNSDRSSDSTIFDSLVQLLDSNNKAVVINAGTPMGLGFTEKVRSEYVSRGQFIDVGIAEETAMAMISGIAKNGGTPVFGTFAPFLQRTYDQLSHDLCLNDNPATILNLMSGVFGMNSNTHIALCDIAFFSHVPNLIYLAPGSKEEYLQMFKFATTQKAHPVALKVPAVLIETGVEDTTDYSEYNKSQVVQKGSNVAIIGVGCLLEMAKDTAEKYKKESGKDITVINPKFLTGLDEERLEDLKKDHKLVITLEDGELDGGFGQRVASFYGESEMKVKNFGISKKFHTDFNPVELLARHGMSAEQLVDYIKQFR